MAQTRNSRVNLTVIGKYECCVCLHTVTFLRGN
jgi:hypothetical protein